MSALCRGGAASTVYWTDPEEEIVCLFFTQVMHARANLKKQLKRFVYAALDGGAKAGVQKPRL